MTTPLRERNLATVRMVCERWHEMSREDYRACFAKGSVYVNIPKPEVRRIGPDEAYEALLAPRERSRIELEVLHIQGDERVVMCERLERFTRRDQENTIDLYVVGVFEMAEGMITEWRDYYESSQIQPPAETAAS